MQRRESDVSAGIRFGHSSNEIGFGWTNAAVLDLLAGVRKGVVMPRHDNAPDAAYTRRADLKVGPCIPQGPYILEPGASRLSER